MGKIYVGFGGVYGWVAATTKAGLARSIGVSVDTVRRNLVSGNVKSGDGKVVLIGEVELEKVEKRGGKNWESGFLGMKGNDGLLVK